MRLRAVPEPSAAPSPSAGTADDTVHTLAWCAEAEREAEHSVSQAAPHWPDWSPSASACFL